MQVLEPVGDGIVAIYTLLENSMPEILLKWLLEIL